MDELNAVFYIDWKSVIIAFFTLALAILFVVEVCKKIQKVFGIEFAWQRERREDHELLVNDSTNLKELEKTHSKDVLELKECLVSFIEEVKKENAELQRSIQKQEENNFSYREVSRGIRDDLANSIKAIAESQKDRDRQIEALMRGSKELLGDTIDKRYSKYIELGGIPQNEVDEFDDIFAAYKGLNGNHGRDTKYNYVKEHLPVIPVKTELIYKK